ncbi:MAG: PHP-associated domain-containing protein [Candidatus Heimdallarchaeaceae archaeon]
MKTNKNKLILMKNNIFDLHVHSHFSSDCKSSPKEIIREAIKKNLKGIAVTDHDTIKFHQQKYETGEILLIPGVEISSLKGHIIGLGIKEKIAKKLSVIETVEKIKDLGGLAIIPHPFDFTRHGIGKNITKLNEIVVETQNGSCPLQYFNTKALKWAKKNGSPQVGGSDAHRIKDIGLAFTIVNDYTETVDDLLEAIRKFKTKAGGNHLSIPEKIIRALQIHF